MHNRLFLLLFLLILIISGCSDKSSNSSNKPETFAGITHTDINGDFNGTIDSTDWRLTTGNPPYKEFWPSGSFGELPDSFGVRPAYPNPANTIITMTFAFPVAVDYEIKIIDKYRHTLKMYDSTNDTGIMSVNWDLRDSLGQKLTPGIYRVVYKFYGIWGCGDIEVVE